MILGEGAARKAWIAAEQDALCAYVAEYEMCLDDGYYTPTENERGLIEDAMQGWVVEQDRLLQQHLRAALQADRLDQGEEGR